METPLLLHQQYNSWLFGQVKGWCSATHNAILHAKAQLVFEVRSFDEHCGHRRAAHDVQFHLHLVLQTLMDQREQRL